MCLLESLDMFVGEFGCVCWVVWMCLLESIDVHVCRRVRVCLLESFFE